MLYQPLDHTPHAINHVKHSSSTLSNTYYTLVHSRNIGVEPADLFVHDYHRSIKKALQSSIFYNNKTMHCLDTAKHYAHVRTQCVHALTDLYCINLLVHTKSRNLRTASFPDSLATWNTLPRFYIEHASTGMTVVTAAFVHLPWQKKKLDSGKRHLLIVARQFLLVPDFFLGCSIS